MIMRTATLFETANSVRRVASHELAKLNGRRQKEDSHKVIPSEIRSQLNFRLMGFRMFLFIGAARYTELHVPPRQQRIVEGVRTGFPPRKVRDFR